MSSIWKRGLILLLAIQLGTGSSFAGRGGGGHGGGGGGFHGGGGGGFRGGAPAVSAPRVSAPAVSAPRVYAPAASVPRVNQPAQAGRIPGGPPNMTHGPAFTGNQMQGNQAFRHNFAQSRPAIGSSPTFSRPSLPNNVNRFGNNPNLGQNFNQGLRNPGNQLHQTTNRPNNPNINNQNLANRQNFSNRPGTNPNHVTVNRPNFNPNTGIRDQNNLQRNQANFNRTQNNFNRNQTNFNSDRRFNNQRQSVVNNNNVYNNNRGSYPNHWAPYRHSGWNVGYWNPGYNMGYGRGGFGAGLATGLGIGALGYGGLGYGGYGGYGGLGYGGYSGYGGYGPYGYGGYGYGYGPYGYGGYYGRNWGLLAGLGLASWAMGPSYYGLGYGAYSNPYYVSSYGGYNYSQPIPYTYSNYYVDNSTDTANPTTVVTAEKSNAQVADELLSSARTEFMNGNYEQALSLVDQAITKTPEDTLLHEFRGLTLFAMKRYPESAAAIYAVLSVSPGWNWSTLSSLYPSVDVYTAQLRALEAEVKSHPEVASNHFLLGYQYLTAGHTDAAQRQFAQAAKLSPNDQTSTQLAKVLAQPATSTSAPNATASSSNNPPLNPQPNPPAGQTPTEDNSPAPNINGQWTASTQGNDSIKLALNQDGTFTWTFNHDGKEMKHDGQFEQHGDNLILDFKEGGGMVGKVTKSDSGFHFVIVNGPPNDPGLNFKQS